MRLQRDSNGERFSISPATQLGAGGEAKIYSVDAEPPSVAKYAVKIYHRSTQLHEAKLGAMLLNPPEDPLSGAHTSIAWPLDRVYTVYNGVAFKGYLMARVEGMRPIFTAYNPATRRQQTPFFNYRYLLRAARNLISAARALHLRGVVIGDVNESNILVGETALITLVDTDSFQVPDPQTGKLYRCLVGKPEYTPPEIQGRRFANLDRTKENDLFGLAILLFQLLMEGTHPFAGIYLGGGDPPTYENRILQGHFPFGSKSSPFEILKVAPPITMLDPLIRQLFLRCFEEGHSDPSLRPDTQIWLNALADAERNLVKCGLNPQHLFGNHLKNCPWCERTELLDGRDPFPSEAISESAPPNRVLAQSLIPKPVIAPKLPAVAPQNIPLQLAQPSGNTGASLASWQMNSPISASLNGGVPGAPIPTAARLPLPKDGFSWTAMGWGTMALASGFLGLRSLDYLLVVLTALFGILGYRQKKIAGQTMNKIVSIVAFWFAGVSLVPSLYGEVTADDRNVISSAGGGVLSLAFSPDGKCLVSGTGRVENQNIIGGMVDLWDVKSQNMIGLLDEKRGDIVSVAYSPDGENLVMGHDTPLGESEVTLMSSTVRGTFRLLAAERTLVNQVAFSPDGNYVAAAYQDRRVVFWDVKNRLVDKTLFLPGPCSSLAFSPDNRYLAVGTNAPLRSVANSTIEVWERRDWARKWTVPAHGKGVRTLKFTPDSLQLASGGNDGAVDIRRSVDGKLVRRMKGQGFWVQAIAFSPDGKRMASASMKDSASDMANEATLWNVSDWTPVKTYHGHSGPILAVAFSPDNKILATGSKDSTIRMWKLK